MSKIGRKLITIPAGVEVNIDKLHVAVKWAKGNLERTMPVGVIATQNEWQIEVKVESDNLKNLRGLSRTLINNMIVGVSEWYTKKLLIIWVGYGAQVSGNKVIFSLWYAHKVDFPIPAWLEVKTEQDVKWNTIITIIGINKELVGEVAAKMRQLKKPEPYKGKWIRYFDEFVKIKPGKSAKK